ncbi:MAG: hypothetical protein QME75_10615 [Deltaproteobacteria bacterium]|nr:hypothetical protein [Deltaproteobacteria bacterium]
MSEKTLFLGIDPGAAGGFALLDAHGRFVAGDKWRDGVRTLRGLAPYAPRVARCHLERVNLFPRQAKGFITQMQSLLVSAGRWQQILEFLHVPYELIHPQTWQVAFGLYHWQSRRAKVRGTTGKLEGFALTPWDLAARLWPEAGIKGQGQSGMAVGLLLAEHARGQHEGPLL